MRRVALFLLLSMSLSAAPAAAALPDEPYGGADQVALSLWLHREGSKLTLYVAQGGRHFETSRTPPDTYGLPAYGAVGRGPCTVTKKGGMCRVKGQIFTLTTEFEMDPLLESAHMTLEAGKFTHVVDWTGEESVSQDSDLDGPDAYASMYRPALATATLYGLEFGEGSLLALMQTEIYGGEGERLLDIRPDGTFTARVGLDAERRIVAP